MATHAETKRLLIVDDHESFAKMLAESLRKKYLADIALSPAEADESMEKRKYSAALIDIRLGEGGINGIELAKKYSHIFSNTAVILMSQDSGLIESINLDDSQISDAIAKDWEQEYMLAAIENSIRKNKMPQSLRKKRFKLLKGIYQHRSAIRFLYRQFPVERSGEYIEKINGETKIGRHKLSWVIYKLADGNTDRKHEAIFTIGLASTIGCANKCQFCLSGQKRFVRKLSYEETLSQIVHGLESPLSQRMFEAELPTLDLNFTCGGDPIAHNLENTAKAIYTVNSIEGLYTRSIITSIGHEANLKLYLRHYINLENVRHYWSVNDVREKIRAEIMPASEDSSLTGLRDLYQQIAEKTGYPVTASFILIPGTNDTPESFDKIAKIFAGRPFEIKVQPCLSLAEKCRIPAATEKQLARFKKEVEKRGLSCRIRDVVGADILAGCGTTIYRETQPPTKT